MDPETLEKFRAALPILEDEEANSKLHDPRLVLYTTAEIPPAYQKQDTGGVIPFGQIGNTTFHSPFYNISADPSDQGKPLHGNWANEFPWMVGRPGMAHNATTSSSIKGFLFHEPAAVFYRSVEGRTGHSNTTNILDWVFAEKTLFVEVLLQRINGQDVPFEVRFREKHGADWEFEIFRPFPTAESLAEALEAMPATDKRLEGIAALRSSEPNKTMRLADDDHYTEKAYEATTEVFQVPLFGADTVLELLDRPFKPSMGEKFKGNASAADNFTRYLSIVPAQYYGSHLTPTGTSVDCMSCHESAGRHGTSFQARRGAYGRIPGGWTEKINSWHPVEPGAISPNGTHRTPVLRKSFIDNDQVVFVNRYLPEGYKFTKVD